ncbi:MAG: DUF115 domain-containing protein [Treponema sp.]|nr:DUF115 domain-containing protein [Treponema sp.]
MTDSANKPCLAQAGQGFSVLYNGRYLYSRYAPEKAAEQTVERLTLLPGSLIICASPVLWYGMSSLLQKLPEHCEILAVEKEQALYDLAEEQLREKPFSADSRLHLLSLAQESSAETNAFITRLVHFGGSDKSPLPPLHTFRRAILVELSGGAFLHAELYSEVHRTAQNTIATWWKNRLTLVRFGRLYARNLFKNLSHSEHTLPFSSLVRNIQQPILVCGAGESAEETLKALNPQTRSSLYLIAVDAALPVVLSHGYSPDAVVAVESQLAIEKAYIGAAHTAPLLLCDAVSRPAVTVHTAPDGKVSYFLSAYTDARYLSVLRKKGLLPPEVPPLGSVGLTATYLALALRATQAVLVFVTGLDFSYSAGKTHVRGAPAEKARLSSCTRLTTAANYAAAFKADARAVPGKSGIVFTDTALSGYATQFCAYFAGTPNLFDAGTSGIPLNLPQVESRQLCEFLSNLPKNKAVLSAPEAGSDAKERIHSYLKEETQALTRLKTLLIEGEKARDANMTVQEEIALILKDRDYLYLHFPDGYECRPADISFLKRVRSEIDFFLKDFTRI